MGSLLFVSFSKSRLKLVKLLKLNWVGESQSIKLIKGATLKNRCLVHHLNIFTTVKFLKPGFRWDEKSWSKPWKIVSGHFAKFHGLLEGLKQLQPLISFIGQSKTHSIIFERCFKRKSTNERTFCIFYSIRKVLTVIWRPILFSVQR